MVYNNVIKNQRCRQTASDADMFSIKMKNADPHSARSAVLGSRMPFKSKTSKESPR